MAKKNKKDVVQLYLSKLDSSKFMNKEKEQSICKLVQDSTDQIFETCLPYPIFRQQLYKLKDAIDSNNRKKIIRVMKGLTETSPEKDFQKIETAFSDLFQAIDRGKPIKKIIKDLKFTNSAIMAMIASIKELQRKLDTLQLEQKRSFEFLEVNTRREYDLFVSKCMSDSKYLKKYAVSLYTHPDTIIKHIRNIEDTSEKIGNIKLSDEFKGIEELYSKIESLENSAKQYRDQLIEANLPLVVNRAKRFIKSQMEFEDLIQEGNIGLMKAIDKFEYDKGFRLTTYATWWIDQAIRRAISNKSSLVRIPIHIQDRLQKINKSYFQLCQQLNRDPSLLEISEDTGISIEEVTGIMTSALHEISVDTQINEGLSVNDLLTSNKESPVETISKTVFQEKLRSALAVLKPKYEKVLRLRFGIGESNDHTLEEIGQHLGLTKERIRQIEKKALAQVSKKPGIKDGI